MHDPASPPRNLRFSVPAKICWQIALIDLNMSARFVILKKNVIIIISKKTRNLCYGSLNVKNDAAGLHAIFTIPASSE